MSQLAKESLPGQDQEFVKGLGLTSATTLVMGSMIGSGVFIVAADIARIVDSPALLIAAWLVTGFMTVVAALSYGELAAMMPKAGGQYVYLREALGPLWGFLYGWTLFLVIQCGTIAIYNTDGTLREPTMAGVNCIKSNPEILAVVTAIHRLPFPNKERKSS